MSEQERIETVLANVERPSFVKEIRFTLDNDWAGDPGVFIWVILQDDIAASREILKYTTPIRSAIAQALRAAEIDRWPYVHIRGASEQTELDRTEAA